MANNISNAVRDAANEHGWCADVFHYGEMINRHFDDQIIVNQHDVTEQVTVTMRVTFPRYLITVWANEDAEIGALGHERIEGAQEALREEAQTLRSEAMDAIVKFRVAQRMDDANGVTVTLLAQPDGSYCHINTNPTVSEPIATMPRD